MSTTEPDAGGNDSGGSADSAEAKGLRNELSQLRKAAKAAEAELAKYKEAEEANARAKMDEVERLKADFAKAQSDLEAERTGRLHDRRLTAAEREAQKLGFHDPSDIKNFLDVGALDDDGLAEAVAKLAETKPHLVKVAAEGDTPAAPGAPAVPAWSPPAPGDKGQSPSAPAEAEGAFRALMGGALKALGG